MKLNKLLVYIEANFLEGVMEIMEPEFAEVGLTFADMRRYLIELTKQNIIHFKGLSYAVPTDPYTIGRVQSPTAFSTMPVFIFEANISKVKKRLKKYELIEKPIDKTIHNPISNEQEMHNVHFDKGNGFLYIDGKKEGEVNPSTDHYIFISILYSRPNLPVSHQEIYKEVKKNKKTAILPQTLSNSLKSEIKRKFIPSINKIISPAKTVNGENGYILRGNIE